jgi:hypothetical protein
VCPSNKGSTDEDRVDAIELSKSKAAVAVAEARGNRSSDEGSRVNITSLRHTPVQARDILIATNPHERFQKLNDCS